MSCPIPLQEIAEKCGLNCASYLVYVINKYLGMTPSKYRIVELVGQNLAGID